MMSTALTLLRSYIVWALLLGQGFMIVSWMTGVGWEMWTTSPHAVAVIGAILAVGGVVGMVCEWVYRSRFDLL